MGGLALLLRYLTAWQAIDPRGRRGGASISTRCRGSLARCIVPVKLERRFISGIVLYPLSVLLLIVAFADRLDMVAAAWGVLAFGDGMATLVGTTTYAAHRFPWNREKSVAGIRAFVVVRRSGWLVSLLVVPPHRHATSLPVVLRRHAVARGDLSRPPLSRFRSGSTTMFRCPPRPPMVLWLYVARQSGSRDRRGTESCRSCCRSRSR